MFRVEVLPTSGTTATPGWTYVADRGIDPSKRALAPTLNRKRGIRDAGKSGDISSRRANAISRHLDELDRENQRDVHIPVPVKQAKEAGVRGTRAKTTSNVRRILQSQKTFKNYLENEEAALAVGGGGAAAVQGLGNVAAAAARSKVAAAAARRSSTPASVVASGRRGRISTGVTGTGTGVSTPTPAPSQGEMEDVKMEDEPRPKLLKTKHDNDPLLRSYALSMPSERVMQRLLSEPPLSYNAARAGPPSSTKPPRAFCCMCGYWGKIKCKSCHLRTCGLDCYRVHEDSRCGAFF